MEDGLARFSPDARRPGTPWKFHYANTTIASCLALPELPLAAGDVGEAVVFRIELHAQSRLSADHAIWRHDFPSPQGQVALTAIRTETCLGMRFPGVADIWLEPGGRIGVWHAPGASDAAVRHVLLDQALPRLLAQRGELVLHAAMLRTGAGRTLLLLGDSGRGKSTLTGAALASGREILTDDGAIVAASETAVLAFATYPSLRLLPDSLGKLFPADVSSALPMAHYSSKRRVAVDARHRDPLALDAIVIIGGAATSGPTLTRMTPGGGCLELMRHGFQLDLSCQANVASLLAKAAEVARRIPIHRLDYPRDYAQLPAVLALLDGSFV